MKVRCVRCGRWFFSVRGLILEFIYRPELCIRCRMVIPLPFGLAGALAVWLVDRIRGRASRTQRSPG
jgi:hypothetical protein